MSKTAHEIRQMMAESVTAFESKYHRRPAFIWLSAAELATLEESYGYGPKYFNGIPLVRSHPAGFGLQSDDVATGEEVVADWGDIQVVDYVPERLSDAEEMRFIEAEFEGKADGKPPKKEAM